jgi:hypothetical protein
MSGLIIAAAVTGCVVAYLVIGFRYAAPRYVTRQVADQIEEYPSLARDPKEVARWRHTAAVEAFGPALIWPLYLACLALKPAERIARRAPLTDLEARAEIRKRDERIAQLEREAGIRS